MLTHSSHQQMQKAWLQLSIDTAFLHVVLTVLGLFRLSDITDFSTQNFPNV